MIRRQDNSNQNYIQLRFGNFKFENYIYRLDTEFLIFNISNDDYSSRNEKTLTLSLSSIKDIVFNSLKRLKLVYYSNNKILTDIELRRETRLLLLNFLECLTTSISQLPKHDNLQNELLSKLNVSNVISRSYHLPSNEKKIEWINLTINDAFEPQLLHNISTNIVKSHCDSKQTVTAIRTVIEDFAYVCEEFEPKLACNSFTALFLRRDGLHTYTDMLKDRIVYELSSFIAIDTLPTSGVDQELLGILIPLVIRIESLSKYPYLLENFITKIFDNISSSLDLIRLFINSSNNSLSNWIISVLSTSPRQRGSQLTELNQMLKKFLANIHITPQDSPILDILQMLKQDLSTKLILTFCSYLESLRFDLLLEDEQSLLCHITACQTCYEHVALMSIPLNPEDSTDISSSSLQLLLDTCENSVIEALTILLNYNNLILQQITNKLFKETTGTTSISSKNNNNNNNNNTITWIGGAACKQYVDKFSLWKESYMDLIPIQFHRLLVQQLSKMMLLYYIQSLIQCYCSNKRMKLSQEGVVQVTSDLSSFEQWITSQKVKPSSELHLNLIIQLIKTMRLFISADSGDIILCFSEAIQMFGVGCRLHLYDFMRMAMKVRSDLPANIRKYCLSLCSEFLTYIQLLLQSPDYSLGALQGSEQSFTLLHQMFPLAGVEHCTGKKWSLETTSNLISEDILTVHGCAQEACRISLIRLKGIKEKLKESNDAAELHKITLERNRIYHGIFDREICSPVSSFSRLSSNESFNFNNDDASVDSPSTSSFAALHHALRPFSAYGHSCYMGEPARDLDVSVFITVPSEEEVPKSPSSEEKDAAAVVAEALSSMTSVDSSGGIKPIMINGKSRYQSVRFTRSIAPTTLTASVPVSSNVRRPFSTRTISTNTKDNLDPVKNVTTTGASSSHLSDVVKKRASRAFRFNSNEPSSPVHNIKSLADERSDSDSDGEG